MFFYLTVFGIKMGEITETGGSDGLFRGCFRVFARPTTFSLRVQFSN